MELLGSTSDTSLTLFRAGMQSKLVVRRLARSTRNAVIYACPSTGELSQSLLDVINRKSLDESVRSYHLRKAMAHIKEAERLEQEERAAKS